MSGPSATHPSLQPHASPAWTFLAYGDSNTWGYDPASGGRLPQALRWPRVAARVLGAGCDVVEEGLNGRTTVHDDPLHLGRNGLAWLRPCLETHRPLDALVLMLGTNDLKLRFGLEAEDVVVGLERLLEVVRHLPVGREGSSVQCLVVAPPPLSARGPFAWAFDREGREEETSRRVAALFAHLARRLDMPFLDAGMVTRMSAADGIHLDAQGHEALGRAVGHALQQLREAS
jgi:lysophospholipase L1-like esterase